MSNLFENILTETYIWEKIQAIKEGKKMTWEQIAVALYQILDDIDTLDDACKENSEFFREMVMKTQAKKGKYMASFDGMTVQRVDEKRLTGFVTKNGKVLPHSPSVEHENMIQAHPDRAGLVQYRNYNWNDLIIRSVGVPSLEELRGLSLYLAEKDVVPKLILLELFSSADDLTNHIPTTSVDIDNVPRNWVSLVYRKAQEAWSDLAVAVESVYHPTKNESTENSPQPTCWEMWAQDELQRAGLFDKNSDYEGMLGEAIMELVKSFSRQGHSGMSAAMTSEIFNRLASWKSLTSLTDDPDEWMELEEEMVAYPEMRWQSRRDPSCFSGDGGKTYWTNDDKCFKEVDKNGITWHTGGPERFAKRTIHMSKLH